MQEAKCTRLVHVGQRYPKRVLWEKGRGIAMATEEFGFDYQQDNEQKWLLGEEERCRIGTRGSDCEELELQWEEASRLGSVDSSSCHSLCTAHFAHHARWPPTQGRFPLRNDRAHGGDRMRIALSSVGGRGYDHHENQERILIHRFTSFDATVLKATFLALFQTRINPTAIPCTNSVYTILKNFVNQDGFACWMRLKVNQASIGLSIRHISTPEVLKEKRQRSIAGNEGLAHFF